MTVPAFLKKIFDMLMFEPPEIIGWSQDGTVFEVRDAQELQKVCLRKYFNHNKYSSFQRQLNYFGFERLMTGKRNVAAYRHPFFQKGKPEALEFIKRKTNSQSQSGSGCSSRKGSADVTQSNSAHKGRIDISALRKGGVELSNTKKTGGDFNTTTARKTSVDYSIGGKKVSLDFADISTWGRDDCPTATMRVDCPSVHPAFNKNGSFDSSGEVSNYAFKREPPVTAAWSAADKKPNLLEKLLTTIPDKLPVVKGNSVEKPSPEGVRTAGSPEGIVNDSRVASSHRDDNSSKDFYPDLKVNKVDPIRVDSLEILKSFCEKHPGGPSSSPRSGGRPRFSSFDCLQAVCDFKLQNSPTASPARFANVSSSPVPPMAI